MYILLINRNPVVSRLLALCTRDDSMTLEEVDNIEDVKRDFYDIVFVDEMSYKDEVLVLDRHLKMTQKVLFSNEDIDISAFDFTIKKPFLPSQIIDILEDISENSLDEVEKENISIFPLSVEGNVSDEPQVLDAVEVEKIKGLLDMNDETPLLETLSDDEIEIRKIEVIKEQLLSDGLEIIEEDKILEELDTKPQILKKKKKKKKKIKLLKYSKVKLEGIEQAIKVAMTTLKRKKIKKLLNGETVKINVKIEGYN